MKTLMTRSYAYTSTFTFWFINDHMNKNKIIFSIIWWVLLLLLFLWVSSLKTWPKKNTTWHINVNNFTIWIVNDEINKFQDFLAKFKANNPKYANTNFTVESFPSYSEYYYSLIWAFLKWTAPDIFVLNNNEKTSIFEEQILWIDPDIFNPNDLSKDFEPVFTSDLILKTEIDLWWDEWKQTIEFIKWVPMWYETMWMFYSFRNFKWRNLSTWAWLNDAVSRLVKKRSDFIPVALWNWRTIISSYDIITSILVQSWVIWLDSMDDKSIKQSFYTYQSFGDLNWSNKYNKLYSEILKKWYSNLDLFSQDKVGLVIWYPRLINEINNKWFNKKFLRASPFPQSNASDWTILINYNYFVMNKNSNYTELWKELIKYFSSESWEKEFLKQFPYYLPAHLSLLSRKLDEKIHPGFWVKLWNFYNDNAQLVSFDKKNKVLYDEEIINVLDDNVNYVDLYKHFRKILLCKYWKMINQEWLSRSCE